MQAPVCWNCVGHGAVVQLVGMTRGWLQRGGNSSFAFIAGPLQYSRMLRRSCSLLMLACLGLTSCDQRILERHTATAIFQDVASARRWDAAGEIVKTYPSKAAVPNYLVTGGRLHLLIQVTQAGVFVNYVDQPTWNRRKLVELGAKHRELSDYLPQARWPSIS